ncbi:hypothetical protein J7T55_002284 [Diaporthe amygdali]|uniref:uncharacterized protein n=1 Tax=Phomopsis amygdali TaxID=1214568 RepID=UPI0022FDDE33|nr:uncharacterized protein J7T55_002284 [Diaporthe amygdali]KAJ0109092.1 hypothetical protein J7T55_002284 [Diaporthe amygdali]
MAGRRSARLSAQAQTQGRDEDAPAAVMPPPSAPAVKSRKRKAPSSSAAEREVPAEAPATPKRRAKKSAVPSLPSTPTATPSAVRLIAEPAATPTSSQGLSSSVTPKPKSRAVARLADPNSTNAPLLSPETSRVISHKPTTTANMLEEACSHLIKVEPRIEPLITAHHCRIFSPAGLAEKIDPFESLASGIISQQVSGAAAKAIKARFINLFDPSAAADATTTTATNKFPTPSQVAAASIESLRSAGLSQRKAEYIQGLAAKFAAGELTATWLADAPYEEVLERLIAVRGLGRWSVEMFACFGLKRMDVFSTGDLGVQRGMAAFAGRDVSKLKAKGGGNKWKYMSEKEMVDMAAPFSPYRSLFMWYMWRVEETDVSTLE